MMRPNIRPQKALIPRLLTKWAIAEPVPHPFGPKGKQIEFVEQYLIDLNATLAAIRSGYSVATARKIGSENLTKLDIQAAIRARRDELNSYIP